MQSSGDTTLLQTTLFMIMHPTGALGNGHHSQNTTTCLLAARRSSTFLLISLNDKELNTDLEVTTRPMTTETTL